ncbi:LLM class flavin-dependent oxidoreductase [Klebsiella michiganensis]|uniref:LLM class flavin-dependent oxidoreductase n=2 Tax=Klebsiella michiganensis TaxID=1134687 RepID=UPI0032DA26C6
MTTILHIDSSILGSNSVSRSLTAEIVAKEVKLNPGATLLRRDLVADELQHLSPAHLAVFQGNTPTSESLANDIALGSTYIDELFSADIIIIGVPMYNFSLPSQLKAWLDRVLVAGRTFHYTANGPEGLLPAGKKVYIASTRGGVYSGTSPVAHLDHQETLLTAALSFASLLPERNNGRIPNPAERLAALLEEITLADEAGIDVFGVGEHHRTDFADSSPAVILAAAAARTKKIRLTSAVSVLSTVDPVRLFQDFSTLDLLSQGRAEITVGRGSFAEAYSLFGHSRDDYDALFTEKLGLLQQLVRETHITWSGRYRPALTGQGVYPRPMQNPLPVWVGVGGTPHSFIRAGAAGLPLMVALIGGRPDRFRPLIDLYRQAGIRAGYHREQLRVGLHVTGFVADSAKAAKDAFYPGWLHAFTQVGKERGWGPVTREQFDASCSPDGAYLVGDPPSVIAKAQAISTSLGGIDRLSFQMSAATAGSEAMGHSIKLIGHEVAAALREKKHTARIVY